MEMTSMFLKPCCCSAEEGSSATPRSDCLCPVLQLSRLEGRIAAPESQITAQEQAVCSPGHSPAAPFCLLPPHCSLIAKALLKHFQLNCFLCCGFSVPERTFSWRGRVIRHWSGGESFSQSTGDTHLATCLAWFRSGAMTLVLPCFRWVTKSLSYLGNHFCSLALLVSH